MSDEAEATIPRENGAAEDSTKSSGTAARDETDPVTKTESASESEPAPSTSQDEEGGNGKGDDKAEDKEENDRDRDRDRDRGRDRGRDRRSRDRSRERSRDRGHRSSRDHRDDRDHRDRRSHRDHRDRGSGHDRDRRDRGSGHDRDRRDRGSGHDRDRRDRGSGHDRDRRDRGYDRDRRDYRRRDPSPRRPRDRERDEEYERRRHKQRDPSPASASAKNEQDENAEGKPKKFWDGFQWVIQHEEGKDTAGQPNLNPANQQTRQDRRLYIGNLEPTTTEAELTVFLNECMKTCMSGAGCAPLPPQFDNAVLSVWLGPETKYAFVEFVTKECALIAVGLTGIELKGKTLKISRPNNYAANAATTMASQMATQSMMMTQAMAAMTPEQIAGLTAGMTGT